MRRIQVTIVLCAIVFSNSLLLAQEEATPHPAADTKVLDEQQWKELDQSVERGLKWLATQQEKDGSFPTIEIGQPGVTGLCLMAFMAQGHIPGEGEYGDQLQRALDYIVSCQKHNGVLAAAAPNGERISRAIGHQVGFTSVYNHAVAGLVLSECYAMAGSDQNKQIKPIIQKALDVTYQMQDFKKDRKVDDEGGWRYLDDYDNVDSDLSITGWQLMFMRSAKNAGFDIEEQRIERAVKYVHRCFLEDHGTFAYKAGHEYYRSRGMAGAGILALAHAGQHKSPKAQRAGDWILKSGFHQYNETGRVKDIKTDFDRYHYGLLICSQAMYQLGGKHWREFFPTAVRVLIANQNPEGSWKFEKNKDKKFGNAYTTAISVLALSACNEILPIFQR